MQNQSGNNGVVNHQAVIAFRQRQGSMREAAVGNNRRMRAIVKSFSGDHLLDRLVSHHIGIAFGLNGNALAKDYRY